MSMGMGMSLVMTQSQRLEMRQLLEARLEQAMVMTQKQVMEMRLYLRREDVFKKLYVDALSRGDVRHYQKHGLDFEYARVRASELPLEIAVTGNCGFSHCLYNAFERLICGTKVALARGSWLLFVVPDFFTPTVFPESYIEYVAVHEHGEEVTLGDHSLASKLEFSVAKIESQLTSYMQWLEDNYPEKFADVFSNQRQVVLPDSEEFQQMLELKSREDYALSIREAIEGFSWPYKLLQKLSLYERRGREVEELMMSTCAAASNVARSLSDALPLPQGLEQIAAALRLCLAKVKERQKYICWPRANEKYESARSGIADEFAIYRKRHELALQEQYGSAGYATFAQELDIIGGSGNLPTGGIFSPHIADALKALANA